LQAAAAAGNLERMTPAQQQLVGDIVALTGAAPPDWSADDAPTLRADVPSELYLIGMIGGKDVGKSSLVNALLGENIAAVSNHGEGTSRALAYVHDADALAARALLEDSAAGGFDLVQHGIDEARGRVLLDLPDVDSVWDDHLDLTRRMLRNMLFPVWVQSIEKYADAATLELLARVAEGNSPQNFVFVLTKVDQLARRHGAEAVEELKADFALRVGRACGIETRPAVYGVDSVSRQGFDLAALRATLLQRRTSQSISDARGLAERQQANTLRRWLAQQRIDEQLAAAQRALAEAESMLASRVVDPLLERQAALPISPAMIEPTVRARIGYWPIVSAIDAALGPALAVFRARTEPWAGQSIGGRQVAQHVRGVFADLSQRQPRLVELYSQNKLWEADVAQRAAGVLEDRLEIAAESHRAALLKRAARPSFVTRIAAYVLTVGAALWFPIVQPVLEIVLQQDIRQFTTAMLLKIVQLLGASYLISSIGFLAIYFVALWIWLRWHTVRRVERTFARTSPTDDPAAAVDEWAANLLAPLRRNVERLQSLADRIAALTSRDRAAA